ncbi:RNA polymerase subunit sigma-70 [Ahniella affigens]|uniref:RNA polymerase subunit sigma-70 n=1 Tax=Ahniella affigens TaxID=2021234 RepID=A0A2P1PVC6_9GAMM|nr:ECF-type sigma factor [Ahniella affigens]AVP98798.1 RNA polymerase subunit sigma-70 [Ahniella affigens]
MSDADAHQLTQWLQAWSAGDEQAADRVLAAVYARIKQLAGARLRRESSVVPLAPTELAHEVIANLLAAEASWTDRAHFFKTVAVAMRNHLHDLARHDLAEKRGGGQQHLTLGAAAGEISEGMSGQAGDLHEAMNALRKLDARKADVIELHWLVGLGLEDVAATLDVSLATVNRDLRFARAWLKDQLSA